MRIFAFAFLTVLLLAGPVAATYKDWWVYDTNIDSYTGQIARDRRIFDPYSRSRYFGLEYERQYLNYGMKGPTDRMMNTGGKSAFSGVFNLDTNSFTNMGRTPGHISNWDPNVRGYARLDVSVPLLPNIPLDLLVGPNAALTKGTARIISLGDAYGAGLNKPAPRTQFFLQAVNLPPVGTDEVYEAWLFDEDTEYPLSLGLLQVGAGITTGLFFEINRKVDMFDAVMITKEPFPDTDPNPGEIVLYGFFGQTRNVLNPEGSEYEERYR